MSDWLEEGGSGDAVDVQDLLTTEAMDLACQVIQGGALLSMGRTSDGGALGVTVTLDGRWRREYFRDDVALVAWLTGAAEFLAHESSRLAASSGPRKRPRSPRPR